MRSSSGSALRLCVFGVFTLLASDAFVVAMFAEQEVVLVPAAAAVGERLAALGFRVEGEPLGGAAAAAAVDGTEADLWGAEVWQTGRQSEKQRPHWQQHEGAATG